MLWTCWFFVEGCCPVVAFDYLYGWFDWNKSIQSLHIKGGDDLPWFQLFTLKLLDEVLCIFEVVWGLAY